MTLDDLASKIEALLERGATPQRFLGFDSAAAYCDLSAKSLRRLVSAGRLTAFRPVRGRVLVDRVELDSLILGAATHPRTGRGRSR